MKKCPLALQLYSLREATKQDFAATVRAVSKIGYPGVELAGYGNLDAKAAKVALDAAGLQVAGLHVGIGDLRTDLNAVINEALLFGTRHVICASWPAIQFTSAGACQSIGEQLGSIGSNLRAYGLQFSFHNHGAELAVIDGRTVLDWMLSAAAPRDLTVEIDVHWVHQGGQSPAQMLRTLGTRCPLVHLKDDTELGLGPVNFAEVFDAIDSIGAIEWCVVEQETFLHAPLESIRLGYEQLQRWNRT
jgi:sugar phosphate isomerase/epimerase